MRRRKDNLEAPNEILVLLSGAVAVLTIVFFILDLPVAQAAGPARRQTPQPLPVVATLSPQAQSIKANLIRGTKKSGDLVLADNGDFKTLYLIGDDRFLVRVKGANYQESKLKAEQWFKDRGFAQADLCFLKIRFGSALLRETKVIPADFVPSGCPVP